MRYECEASRAGRVLWMVTLDDERDVDLMIDKGAEIGVVYTVRSIPSRWDRIVDGIPAPTPRSMFVGRLTVVLLFLAVLAVTGALDGPLP